MEVKPRPSRPVVLFAAGGFGLPGGIANLSGSVLGALDELAAAGVLAPGPVLSYRDTEAPQRVPRSRPPVRLVGGGRSRFVLALAAEVRRHRPDLVLFDHVRLARSVGVLPPLLRRPFAVMVHGLELDGPARRFAGAVLGRAALVIANSSRTAAKARLVAGDGLADRIVVVHPCVSRRRVEAWSGSRGPDLAQRDPVVLIASRLDAHQPGKGHETLVAAWPEVEAAVPGARLVVTGSGAKRPMLEEAARLLGVDDRIEFVGHVSEERLGALMRRAVVFAMPSRQEGFGIAYAEAMWHGLPCIGATDGPEEVIVDGRTGMLVPFGDAKATADAVVTLLTDRVRATAMGEAGRTRALARFGPDAFRERLGEVLTAAVG